MSKPIARLFLEHPHSVNETYGQHFGVAMGFGLRLIGAGLAAVIHALIPALFKTTASQEIRRLNAVLESRGKTH